MKVITFFLFSIIGISLWGQCPPQSWNMTLLDQWDNDNLNPINNPEEHYSDIWGYSQNGKEYAILGGRDTVFILEVTDPNQIKLIQSIYQGDYSRWRDFKTYDTYLYSVIDADGVGFGINIYDLSDIQDTVIKVNQLDSEFTKCHNIYIDEQNKKLYAVGMSQPNDICMYDLSSPSSPTLDGCYDLDAIEDIPRDGYIHDIFVRNNIAYGSHGNGGYHAWDMSNPSDVKYLGGLSNQFFDNGYVHSSWNSEDNQHAVVATEVGPDPKIYWIDQSNFSLMEVKYKYKEPLCNDSGNNNLKRPHNPYVLGNKIYTSFYHDGLVVLGVEADTLKRLGYYDTHPDFNSYADGSGWYGSWGAFPYLPSGVILVSDRKNGLHTLSFDNLSQYTFIGPGTNWDDSSNWENNQTPPMNFNGLIKINHDVIANRSIVNSLTGRMDVKSGVTVTYSN